MSNDVYPTLPGISYSVVRSVIPPAVHIATTPSEREYVARSAVYPRYGYTLPYEFLRSKAAAAELQTLVGFYAAHGGPFDSFLFLDPDDNTSADTEFAQGDGVTSAFQLMRSFGGFLEPVYDLVPLTRKVRMVDWDSAPLWATGRANQLKWSENFTQGVWTANNVTVTLPGGSAPDGSTTANYFTDTAATSSHSKYQSAAVDPSVYSIFSVFAKAGSKTVIKLALQRADFAQQAYANFILTGSGSVGLSGAGGTASLYSAGIEPLGGGWYRCNIIAAADNASGSAVLARVYMMDTDSASNSYTGDGTGTVWVWGAHLEKVTDTGSYTANRYLKTTGAALSYFTDYYTTSDFQSGVIYMNFTPLPGAHLFWSGQFYKRCRFDGDRLDTEKFMDRLWQAKQVKLITKKP